MKDPLVVAYIAERAELLSRVSPPPVDSRHAKAFVSLMLTMRGSTLRINIKNTILPTSA